MVGDGWLMIEAVGHKGHTSPLVNVHKVDEYANPTETVGKFIRTDIEALLASVGWARKAWCEKWMNGVMVPVELWTLEAPPSEAIDLTAPEVPEE